MQIPELGHLHADGDHLQIYQDLGARPLYIQGSQHSFQFIIVHKCTYITSRSLLESLVENITDNWLKTGALQNPASDNQGNSHTSPCPAQTCFCCHGTFLESHHHRFMMSRAIFLTTTMIMGTLTAEHHLLTDLHPDDLFLTEEPIEIEPFHSG